jgi:hypothetical protein
VAVHNHTQTIHSTTQIKIHRTTQLEEKKECGRRIANTLHKGDNRDDDDDNNNNSHVPVI